MCEKINGALKNGQVSRERDTEKKFSDTADIRTKQKKTQLFVTLTKLVRSAHLQIVPKISKKKKKMIQVAYLRE